MKTIQDHIEDLEAVNEFYEDTAIREAIAFIKSQGKDLHNKDNLCFQQGLLISDLKAEIKRINQITV
jgi:hypothetical protein